MGEVSCVRMTIGVTDNLTYLKAVKNDSWRFALWRESSVCVCSIGFYCVLLTSNLC